ncbi:OmpA family protein [Pseudolysobacter antarcticus]|uniref:OmpA family protein n=1 Tax=Pseudolysobacter antarcticus TaxID=2511995 RepID=A0A411HMR9_9GAMM|nr:OmpA family protein [Pseudolysobacter antarcticus]QBB71777.1 OmpA family protein [Pseudolysobacter antarcticus]
MKHRYDKRIFRTMILLLASLFQLSVFAAGAGADHPLVGRYEGSKLVGYYVRNYDEIDVMNGPIANSLRNPSAPGWLHLEGKIQLYYYQLPASHSSFEVLRNYQDSLKSKGFEIVFTCATSDTSCYMKRPGHAVTTGPYDFANALDAAPELPRYNGDYMRNYFQTSARYLLAKLDRNGSTVYASIALAEGSRESLAIVRVVESKAMESGKIAFVGADEMRQTISNAGRISLYGIHFDFDRDAILPDSKPTLDEIAKLLQADLTLRVNVVGHTDGQGKTAYNLDLSRRRAANVVATLAHDYGIDPARLQPRGAGASEPLASNDNDAGRAQNRRVELVRL